MPIISALFVSDSIDPSDRVIQQTHDAIGNSNLSHYEIGQQWAKESSQSAATLIKRVYRWHGNGLPNAIGDWVALMNVLGYDVQIKRQIQNER